MDVYHMKNLQDAHERYMKRIIEQEKQEKRTAWIVVLCCAVFVIVFSAITFSVIISGNIEIDNARAEYDQRIADEKIHGAKTTIIGSVGNCELIRFEPVQSPWFIVSKCADGSVTIQNSK